MVKIANDYIEWEYKALYVPIEIIDPVGCLLRVLNEQGKEGWEAVSMETVTNYGFATGKNVVFKRMLVEMDDYEVEVSTSCGCSNCLCGRGDTNG